MVLSVFWLEGHIGHANNMTVQQEIFNREEYLNWGVRCALEISVNWGDGWPATDGTRFAHYRQFESIHLFLCFVSITLGLTGLPLVKDHS